MKPQILEHIQLAKSNGEYAKILAFKFDPIIHTKKIRKSKNEFNNDRVILKDAETLLLKKYQILLAENGSKEEISDIENTVLNHYARLISYISYKVTQSHDHFSMGVIKFYKLIRTFNPWSGYALTTYLHTCISREMFSILRRNKVHDGRFITGKEINVCAPPQKEIQEITVQHLIENSGLTNNQVEIMCLMLNGYSQQEIAELRGVDRQAINNCYRRGITRIQDFIKLNKLEI